MAESHGDAKGATAHTEADGGHKAPFPPFQKDTFASQLVSLLIAFVALYLIVSRIALPRVGKTIDDRQGAIEGDLAQAQKLKDESDRALKAYESELAAALRNPSAAAGQFGNLIFGFAVTEALGIFSLLIALLLLFALK